MRDHFSGNRVINEQRANFAPYKVGKKRKIAVPAAPTPKRFAWAAKFVCLADTEAQHMPMTVAHKEVLVEAGLGEKKVDIPDIECSPQDFQQLIINTFPKLRNAGGFELLRCIANSKVLEPLSSAVSMSPKLLRSVVGKSRIFIRPIQRNLELEATEDNDSPAKVSYSYMFW